jgi:hypothetical protein
MSSSSGDLVRRGAGRAWLAAAWVAYRLVTLADDD